MFEAMQHGLADLISAKRPEGRAGGIAFFGWKFAGAMKRIKIGKSQCLD